MQRNENVFGDVVAFAIEQGVTLLPWQVQAMVDRLKLVMAELQATVEDPGALELSMRAALVDILAEVTDRSRLAAELGQAAGEAIAYVLTTGGYSCPTDAQRKQIVGAVRKRAENQLAGYASLEAAADDLRATTRRAVVAVLGQPPVRLN